MALKLRIKMECIDSTWREAKLSVTLWKDGEKVYDLSHSEYYDRLLWMDEGDVQEIDLDFLRKEFE